MVRLLELIPAVKVHHILDSDAFLSVEVSLLLWTHDSRLARLSEPPQSRMEG